MPTHNDETLHDRYAREHADHMARLAKMTPEKIAEMELSLHNAMAELDRLRDQQAQRIGELEWLLREVHDTYRAAIHWEDLRGTMKRIDAALSAGKDSGQ